MFKIGKLVSNIDVLLNNLEYEIVKKRESKNKKTTMIEYINLPCAFDIEVSSFYNNKGEKNKGEKNSLMYIWQFGINGNCIVGRTWNEFIKVMDKVRICFELNDKRRLPIYIHNEKYEFQFIRPYFEWIDIFAREKRFPMKALTSSGFEFRCSYMLSGCSLELTCKNLTKYKVNKKVDDLDYNLIRTPLTPLSDKELDYCIYDVIGLMCYIQEQIELYGNITKIPMTNTGRVRLYCKEKCLNKTKYNNKYKEIIKGLTINDDEEYFALKKAFQGGFTHASWTKAGEVMNNVKSYDFTSSYPTVMVAEMFPMSRGKKVIINNLTELNSLRIRHNVIFYVRFINLRPKFKYEHFLSISKCFNAEDFELDNGRIIRAKKINTCITEIDFDIINEVYEYDEVNFGNGYAYVKGYLPTSFVECVLDFYENKTKLKDVKGKESEYQLFKGMLNSCYGMCVTDVDMKPIEYTDDWYEGVSNISEQINNYNTSRSRFLFYPWGCFICAYARKNLWSGIIECGEDYIYSDTDSIKILNYENHTDYIERYNNKIMRKLTTACEYHKIDIDRISPSTIKGKVKPLGVWDDDGFYTRFKTLGAKRYMVEDNDGLKITIAGVSKTKGSEYLATGWYYDIITHEEHNNPFDFFNDMLVVPKEYSGRLVSTYLDEEFEGVVTDYLGNKYEYYELTGIHMEPSDYKLTMTDIYLELIGHKEEMII